MKNYFIRLSVLAFTSLCLVGCVLQDDEQGELSYNLNNKFDKTVRVVRFHKDNLISHDSVHLYPTNTFKHTSDYFIGYDFLEYELWYDSIHIHYDDSYLVRHYPDNRNGLNRPIFEFDSWDLSKKIINNGISDRYFKYNFTTADFNEAQEKGTKY